MVVIPLLINYFQRNNQKIDFEKYSRKKESLLNILNNIVMKTIKYKTLNGLLNQTRQMTIEQFLK